MKHILRISLLFVLIVLAGCLDVDKPKGSTELAEIDLLEINETGEVNEEVAVRVRTRPYNGCWSNMQVALVQDDVRHLGLVAYGTFDPGDVCPENLVREDTVIKFKPTRAGEYYFRANYAPLPILRDTLHVE